MSGHENNIGTDASLDDIGADLHGKHPSTDKRAQLEADELDTNDYEGKTQKALLAAQESRDETTRHNFHKLFIMGLRVVGISLIVMFVIRVFHIVSPESWHWITPQGQQDIDRMLFSGAAGGLITRFVEPILQKGRS